MKIDEVRKRLTSSLEKQVNDLSERLTEHQARLPALDAELEHDRRLAAELSQRKAKSPELAQRLSEKEQERGEVAKAMTRLENDLKKAKALLAAEIKRLEPATWLLDFAVRPLELTDISVFETVEKALLHCNIHIGCAKGEPKTVKLSYSAGRETQSITLPILCAKARILKGYFPAELRWASAWLQGAEQASPAMHGRDECDVQVFPMQQQDEEDEEGREGKINTMTAVVYISGENTVMSHAETVTWRESQGNYGNRYEDKSRDIGKEVPCLTTAMTMALAKAIKTHPMSVDLDAAYEKSPLLKLIKKSALAATIPVDDVAFKPNEKVETSKEILARIGPLWAAFIDAPWQADIVGRLANLKYYCESGERPRFYSTAWENCFGFRLRTRDHTWLLGDVYLLPEAPSAKANAAPTEVIAQDSYGDRVPPIRFRHGRLCGWIYSEK